MQSVDEEDDGSDDGSDDLSEYSPDNEMKGFYQNQYKQLENEGRSQRNL